MRRILCHIFLKTRRIELSNGVWHMVVRGCAQILCKGRKSAKLQLKSEKTEKKSRAVKLYHGPIFENLVKK
jgi:hypothetical protein